MQGRQAEDRLQIDQTLAALNYEDIEDLYDEDTASEIDDTENQLMDNATSVQICYEPIYWGNNASNLNQTYCCALNV